MSWRPHGHARVDARNPQAFGKCDRCGFLHNLVDLAYQREWAGAKLINLHLRVCSSCMDKPQSQLRSLHLKPDPVPVRDPRPLNNAAVMGGYAYMTRAATQFSTEFSPTDFAFVSNSPVDIQLNVVAPSADTTPYPPVFQDFGVATDAAPGATEESGIPISIDPPEEP